MTLKELLRIPYLLEVCSIPGPDGEWHCRSEYPELPGVVAVASFAMAAFHELDEKRIKYIIQQVELGEPVPVPRPPLEGIDPASELKKYNLTQYIEWLELEEQEIARRCSKT